MNNLDLYRLRRKQRTRRKRVFAVCLVLIAVVCWGWLDALPMNSAEPAPQPVGAGDTFYRHNWDNVDEMTMTQAQQYLAITPSEPPSIFNPDIPMDREHQEYLYQLCQERGLDYLKTLAVLKHESQFDPNAISPGGDFGYMQVNRVNHKYLSKTLETPNDPLDPFVNLNWGTYLLASAYNHWEARGITGEQLDKYALSTYNKGLTGFRNHGKAVSYIAKVNRELEYLVILLQQSR